jgi:hypothetical protein
MLTTIDSRICTDLAELRETLDHFADLAARHPSTVYLDQGGLTVLLVEKTLTDGSTVFDIRLGAAPGVDTCPMCGAEHTE